MQRQPDLPGVRTVPSRRAFYIEAAGYYTTMLSMIIPISTFHAAVRKYDVSILCLFVLEHWNERFAASGSKNGNYDSAIKVIWGGPSMGLSWGLLWGLPWGLHRCKPRHCTANHGKPLHGIAPHCMARHRTARQHKPLQATAKHGKPRQTSHGKPQQTTATQTTASHGNTNHGKARLQDIYRGDL